MNTSTIYSSHNLPLAAIEQELATFTLGGGLDKCTKTFKSKVEAQRPKEFFAGCSLCGTRMEGVDILCILDVPNFRAYRRAHRKPTGMWLGALVQTEDAGICWISQSARKEHLWTIYTENIIRQWASLRNCPEDMPIHHIVSDLLVETMDQDGVSFRYPDHLEKVYQPLGDWGTVQGIETFVEDERCKIYDSFVPEDGDTPNAMAGARPEVAEIVKFLQESGFCVTATVAG
jgi:hypothetical protein